MEKWNKFFNGEGRVVRSEEEMRELGRGLAALLEPGCVLGLVGDLGAGKTRLVQGVLEGLGASAPAVSPTFALVHEHADGRLPVAHFDFYRMSSPEEALGLGWDDYLSSGLVLLVEWADRFEGALMPRDTLWLTIERSSESVRVVRLAGVV
ncbi:MAG: tRNA (adenosine(37)-N6)-threonylcarbamoyltransferase complex ATPase subunit type 1 TsaE [Akkermansiaceae bacterium]|nr:tRNA (adenosine(37)-N6)-threonylcarbamoyltransferase complex ATPase subunit type 1 TsaE [Akkermansiaceae bacterium]